MNTEKHIKVTGYSNISWKDATLKALNQNGLVYTNENIDRLLFERFLSQKARRAGKRTGNLSGCLRSDRTRSGLDK